MNIEDNFYYKKDKKLFIELLQLFNDNYMTCCRKVNSIGKGFQAKDRRYLKHWIETVTEQNLGAKFDLKTKIYWILNNIVDWTNPLVCCKECHRQYLNRNVKNIKDGYRKFCSVKCSANNIDTRNKYKESCINNFGVDNSFKSEEVKDKIKIKIIDEYGVDNVSKNESIKLKKCETTHKNYGVDHPLQSNEIKEKYKKTCLSNFGVCYPTQSLCIQEKTKQHNLSCFGVEFTFQRDDVKEKILSSNIKNLGVPYPMQAESVRQKSKESSLSSYGVEYPIQSHDVFIKTKQSYYYNNILFKNRWELAYYIWLSDNNIKFEYQPNITFKYVDDNKKEHVYNPDFRINDEIIELKGSHFFVDNDINKQMINPYDKTHESDHIYEAKHQCMIKNHVKLLSDNDMKPIMKYVFETYGSDFFKIHKIQ